MLISDWSSDVCSSDLVGQDCRAEFLNSVLVDRAISDVFGIGGLGAGRSNELDEFFGLGLVWRTSGNDPVIQVVDVLVPDGFQGLAIFICRADASVIVGEIGRASCRERVCQYV